jgi:hypothetical protein
MFFIFLLIEGIKKPFALGTEGFFNERNTRSPHPFRDTHHAAHATLSDSYIFNNTYHLGVQSNKTKVIAARKYATIFYISYGYSRIFWPESHVHSHILFSENLQIF